MKSASLFRPQNVTHSSEPGFPITSDTRRGIHRVAFIPQNLKRTNGFVSCLHPPKNHLGLHGLKIV
jgi:hypothetical protein